LRLFFGGAAGVAFLLAAFVIEWLIGRLREHRRERRGEE
jgi:hypothetical protein